jgi:hypothetical protein
MARSILIAALSVAAAGCATEAPTAEIVEVTPDAVVAAEDAKDDLTIVVRYEDPNGDLGGGTARVHDCRSAGVVSVLDIPAIANEEGVAAEIAIEGEIDLLVPDVGGSPLPGRSTVCEEAAAAPGAFCVVLVDAAGNESDAACTEVIRFE